MRNLLAFLMVLVLTVAGLGWYLDWFKVRTTPGTDGHTTLNIDVNKGKILQDAAKVADQVKEKAKSETDKIEAEKKAEAEKTSVQNQQP